MSTSTGSYSFADFADVGSELRRLEAQAELGWNEIDCRALAHTALLPDHRVLDLGCGPGLITRRLGALLGDRGHVVGVDINERLLSLARSHNQSGHLQFTCGNAYDLTAFEGQFDFVYARLLFQHLQKPDSALDQIYQALAPGGTVTVIDIDDGIFTILPEPPDLEDFARQAAAHQRGQGGDRTVGHKLGYLLRRAGFTEVRTFVEILDAARIGMDNFLSLNCSYKWQYFPPGEQDRARQRLQGIVSHAAVHAISAFCGVYVVTGRRPAFGEVGSLPRWSPARDTEDNPKAHFA